MENISLFLTVDKCIFLLIITIKNVFLQNKRIKTENCFSKKASNMFFDKEAT